MYLRIKVIAAAQAQGSWKAVEEIVKDTLIGVETMRVRDDQNRVQVHVRQVSLCLLQPSMARGSRASWHPTVSIRKGDWIVSTPYGGLILSPNEYQALVLQGGRE